MNNSIFSELRFKMVQSGSRMNLFIGINAIVFFTLGILYVIESVFTKATPISDWLLLHLAAPPFLPDLLRKFWTPFTYMFSHRELLHFIFNMLGLYWFGRIFEDFLNSKQFTFTYLAGGFAGFLFFILSCNFLPAFSDNVALLPPVIGASASVMAIIVATATLLPEYSIRLLLFGSVRLKYLALVYIAIDLISIAGTNAGGAIAHLGGALLGFVYIKQLQNGNDWSKIFTRKRRLKVIKNNQGRSKSASAPPDEEVIDQILDKISRSGYDSLTRQEKEQLFKASNKE